MMTLERQSCIEVAALDFRARADAPGAAAVALERATSPSSASTGRGRSSSRPARAGGARRCRLRISTGAAGSRSSSRTPPASGSMRNPRSCRPRSPRGERIQIVLPPATSAGCVAITSDGRPIRCGRSRSSQPAGSFARRAARRMRSMRPRPSSLRLLEARDYEAFMRLAVVSRKNILVSGPTGSGKTTWTKALIREIPREERLITIEDAAGARPRPAPEPRAALLLQGRSGAGARDAEAAAGSPACA